MRGVARPYPDRLILGRGGDVGSLEDGGRPGNVADPVGVAGEFFDLDVGFVLRAARVCCQYDVCLRDGMKGIDHGRRVYLYSQILTTPSLPPVTNFLTPPAPLPSTPGLLDTRLPGCVAGAQLTALTPWPCAGKI